ncbi:MAG: universal stress protein [Kofleriaceae bacterium]
MPWKKILCPVDFSEGSRLSVETAAKLANETDAELVIANVMGLPVYYVVEPIAYPPSFLADLASAAEAGLTRWKDEAIRHGATRISTKLLRGDAAHEIVELAKHDGFDLIIIGTHGRTGLKHMFLGSVAEKVVRHASVPVLVVRQKD